MLTDRTVEEQPIVEKSPKKTEVADLPMEGTPAGKEEGAPVDPAQSDAEPAEPVVEAPNAEEAAPVEESKEEKQVEPMETFDVAPAVEPMEVEPIVETPKTEEPAPATETVEEPKTAPQLF